MKLAQSFLDEARAGHLDAAIQQLKETTNSSDDARMLSFLYKQRGNYDDAVNLLREPPWSETLDSSGLRQRGEALWHAGRLNEALQDLNAAGRAATSDAERNAIHFDAKVLRDYVAAMSRVDRKLTIVDVSCIVEMSLLVAALVHVHRRLLVRLRMRRR